MKRQRVFLIGLSAVWLALAAGLAAAAEYTWTGGGGDACWTNSANWGRGGVSERRLGCRAVHGRGGRDAGLGRDARPYPPERRRRDGHNQRDQHDHDRSECRHGL